MAVGGTWAEPPVAPPGQARVPDLGEGHFDMRAFVNRMADQFQDSARILVDPSAREALIGPALPHEEGVARQLARRALTIEFLEDCVLSVLERARRIAGTTGQSQINATCVEQSMEEECPYLFWC